MTLINFVAYNGGGQKLHRIKEANFAKVYQSITTNVIKSTVAMFMIDLCRHSIKEKEANQDLFEFIQDRFLILDGADNLPPDYHLSFALNLCNYLGFYPQDNWDAKHCSYFDLDRGIFIEDPTSVKYHLNLEESMYLYGLISQNNLRISSTRKLRQNLLDSLMIYYQLHIEGFRVLPSIEVLKTIFAS